MRCATAAAISSIDIEGAPLQAPDIRVLKLFDDTLITLARPEPPSGEAQGRSRTCSPPRTISR